MIFFKKEKGKNMWDKFWLLFAQPLAKWLIRRVENWDKTRKKKRVVKIRKKLEKAKRKVK